jgi:outer membrane protein assembly factor BamB
MRQRFLIVAALMAAWSLCNPVLAQRSQIITEAAAARHGLVRPWFTQVELDQSRGRLQDLILYEGALYAQTDRAMIHAIDAETGKTLWSKQIGRPGHPSLPPTASHDLLATINGSRLYVVNRFTGEVVLEKEIDGAPGAGPALSAKYAYVPTTQGMLVAYRLDPVTGGKSETANSPAEAATEETPPAGGDHHGQMRLRQEFIPPLAFQSSGRALLQPLVMHATAEDEYVAWATDQGHLNFSYVNLQEGKDLELKYRLITDAPMVAPPAHSLPDPKEPGDLGTIFAVSGNGYVYAIDGRKGERLWQFSTGEPIVEAPAVIEDHLYVATQLGGMYCLDVKTGEKLWRAPNIRRFVAASQTRVYAADMLGQILVLNAQNGARLDVLATQGVPIKLFNTDTDRIYLADNAGLIQCLHESELGEPLVHGKERKLAAVEAEKPVKKERGAAAQAAAKKEAVAPHSKKAGKKAEDAAGADAEANPAK